MAAVERLRAKLKTHPKSTFALALLVLLAGVYLIWQNQFTAAPDPMQAELATATKFLGSDRFLSLSSADRNAYLNSLGARYVQESPSNRQMIERALKANGIERSTQRSIALGMLRQILAQYRTLSPDDRQKQIALLRAFVGAMGFKGPLVSGLDPAGNPVAKATGTEADFSKGVAAFHRDVLSELSAEERSTLAIMTHDIHNAK